MFIQVVCVQGRFYVDIVQPNTIDFPDISIMLILQGFVCQHLINCVVKKSLNYFSLALYLGVNNVVDDIHKDQTSSTLSFPGPMTT